MEIVFPKTTDEMIANSQRRTAFRIMASEMPDSEEAALFILEEVKELILWRSAKLQRATRNEVA